MHKISKKVCFRIDSEYTCSLNSSITAFLYPGDPDVILKCIVLGFFANAARIHHSGSYR